MSKFNLNDWISKRGIFKDIEVEGIELQIVSMSDGLKEQLELNHDTHESMVNFIANCGLSHSRNRIADDSELSKDLPAIFALEEFNADCKPSVKEQIAQAVCKLSGLEDLLSEQKLKEEAAEKAKKAKVVDEEFIEKNGETSLGQLEEDEAAEHNYN